MGVATEESTIAAREARIQKVFFVAREEEGSRVYDERGEPRIHTHTTPAHEIVSVFRLQNTLSA